MTNFASAQPKRKHYWHRWLVLGAIVFYFLFCCSGLHWPMWNARGRLAGHLSNDLHLTLPVSAKVVHAVRVATRDPGEYYAVEMNAADIMPFMAQVRTAMTDAADKDAGEPWVMGRAPDWWKPQDLVQVKRLDGRMRDDLQGGYMWYYSSSSSGAVYVFWFEN